MSSYDDDDYEVRHRTVPRGGSKRGRVSRTPGGKPGVAFADDVFDNGPSLRINRPFRPERYGSWDGSHRDLDEVQRHQQLRATEMPVLGRPDAFYGSHPIPPPPPPQILRDLHSRPQHYRVQDKPPYTIRDVPPPPGPDPRPRKGSPKSHGFGFFQAVCDTAEPQNLSVHLELPISEDFEAGLEEFSRLKRLGNFKGAKDYFKDNLETYIDHPYVFVQYAEMLLAMGDFQSFGLLDAEPVFGNDTSSSYSSSSDEEEDDDYPATTELYGWRRHPPPASSSRFRQEESGERARRRSPPSTRAGLFRNERESDTYPRMARSQRADGSNNAAKGSEFQLLRWNWHLLQTLAEISRHGTIDGSLEQLDDTMVDFRFKPTMGSTEIQIASLILHLAAHISRCDGPYDIDVETLAEDRIDWLQLYDNLQAEGRIWDFRDIFVAAAAAFGTPRACEMFFGTQNWSDHIPGDWALDENDESTNIACLDILMSMVFGDPVVEYGVPGEKLNRIAECLRHAGPLAENLMKHYPESMRSRPFAQWILAKAAESGCKREQRLPKPHYEPFHYVWCFEGLSFREQEWAGFPAYAPLSVENPGWQVPEIAQEEIEPMYMALKVSKELQDYHSQALCYKMLILRSQDPLPLFEELTHLQKTSQGDNRGYLRTLVTKYLACKDRLSRIQLLDELKSTDDCIEDAVIRDPQVYCARDFIQRTLDLQVGGRGSSPPLRKSGIGAYEFLPDFVSHFLRKASRRDILPPGYGFPHHVSSRRRYQYVSRPDEPYVEYAVRRAPPQAPPAPARAKSSQPKDKIATVARQRAVEGPFISGGPTPPPPVDPKTPDPRIVTILKPKPQSPTLPESSGTRQDDYDQNQNRALIPYNPTLRRQWEPPKPPEATDEVQRPEAPMRRSSSVHVDSSTESDGNTNAFAKLADGTDKVGGPERLHLEQQKEKVSKLSRPLNRERQKYDIRQGSPKIAESELRVAISERERCKAELLRMEENAEEVADGQTKAKGKANETSELVNSTDDEQHIQDDDSVWSFGQGAKIQPKARDRQDVEALENMATQDTEPEPLQESGSKVQGKGNIRAGFKTQQAPEKTKEKGGPSYEKIWNDGVKGEKVESGPLRGGHLGPAPNYENERESNLSVEGHINDAGAAAQSVKTHGRQNKPEGTLGLGMNTSEVGTVATGVAAQNERISRRAATPMRPSRHKPPHKPAGNKDAGDEGSHGEVTTTDWDNLVAEQRVEIASRPSEGRDDAPAGGWGSTGVWDAWNEMSGRRHARRISGRPKVIIQEVGNSSPTLHRKHGSVRLMDRVSSSLPEDRAATSRRRHSGNIDPDGHISRKFRPVERFILTGDRDGEEADNEEAGENYIGNLTLRGKRGDPVVFEVQDTKKEEQGKGRGFQDREREARPLKTTEASHLAGEEGRAAAGEQRSESVDATMSTKPDPSSEPEQMISRRPTVTDPTPGDD